MRWQPTFMRLAPALGSSGRRVVNRNSPWQQTTRQSRLLIHHNIFARDTCRAILSHWLNVALPIVGRTACVATQLPTRYICGDDAVPKIKRKTELGGMSANRCFSLGRVRTCQTNDCIWDLFRADKRTMRGTNSPAQQPLFCASVRCKTAACDTRSHKMSDAKSIQISA
jgi:hypothetical protein